MPVTDVVTALDKQAIDSSAANAKRGGYGRVMPHLEETHPKLPRFLPGALADSRGESSAQPNPMF